MISKLVKFLRPDSEIRLEYVFYKGKVSIKRYNLKTGEHILPDILATTFSPYKIKVIKETQEALNNYFRTHNIKKKGYS